VRTTSHQSARSDPTAGTRSIQTGVDVIACAMTELTLAWDKVNDEDILEAVQLAGDAMRECLEQLRQSQLLARKQTHKRRLMPQEESSTKRLRTSPLTVH
jgi:hypothetical protein